MSEGNDFLVNEHDITRLLETARSKSDLHRAIDALPDDAKLILVANACCCGDPEHDAGVGGAIFHTAYGNPTLPEALGLLRLTEHRLITTILDGHD
jgi:hypothetical protein